MAKKSKVVIIIIAGILLVAVGAFVSISLIQRFQATQSPATPEEYIVKSDVVVVTRDLFLGDTIARTDVEVASVPVEFVPRTAIANLEDSIGKIIKTDLVQGEMILTNNLADPTNNINDLSFILSENHVLMAFPADDLMSREGIVQRGDIVDIFATFAAEIELIGETDPLTGLPLEPITKYFTVDSMQKVGVTAMVLEALEQTADEANSLVGQNDQSASAQSGRIKAYLLALNPRDALILKHLKDTDANFDIVLRAPTSTIQFDLSPVSEQYIVEFYGLEILP